MAETRRTVLKAAALAGTAFFIPTGVLDAFEDTPTAPLGADNRPIRDGHGSASPARFSAATSAPTSSPRRPVARVSP